LAWGGFVLYQTVRDAPYFRLQTVQIQGNATLTQHDVQYLLALPVEATLLQLDLERMGARLERHPYVQGVTLRRRFPDTLLVTIQERTPYLVVVSDWQRAVLDTAGVVLRTYDPQHDGQFVQLKLQHTLALSPGMHMRQLEVQRALALIRAYHNSPVASMMHLMALRVEDSGVSEWEVEPYRFTIRVGERAVETQLERLPVVLHYIQESALAVRLVDVSYRQRVVVTLATS
jgi:cell division septal protein FtsQ